MQLSELEYDHAIHRQSGKEADSGLAVRFYLFPEQDAEASLSEGRAIFRDKEYVEIRVRGDRNNVASRPLRPDDKIRFVDAYKAFKAGAEQALVGTPLAEWPSLSKSMVEELKYLGFHTVEQLATASDAVCGKFAGLPGYKQKAAVFIDYAKNQQPIEELSAKFEKLNNEAEVDKANLAAALEQIKKLTAQMQALQKAK